MLQLTKGQKLENVIEREISCFQQITPRTMSYNVDELEHLYSYKEFLKYILQQEIIGRKAIRAIDMYLSSVHFAT